MTALFSEFTDPRLVALYDTVCHTRDDFEFYLRLARELAPSTIIDIGCGTGTLTCELAGLGFSMIGVDPSSEMLEVARARPGGDRVRWVEGDATRLDGTEAADLVIMTGHVAQVIADDETWNATLAAAHRALRLGGRIAFESRDPRARGWTAWTAEAGHQRFEHSEIGSFDLSYELIEVTEARVRCELHYVIERTGEELVSRNELRFPTEAALTSSLIDAGFDIEQIYGDWDRRLVGDGTPELIYVARRV